VEFRQLEYFARVAQLCDVTRATNFLSAAQPVPSRQVRLHEAEFRRAFLERSGRGVLAQIACSQLDVEESRRASTRSLAVALPPGVSLTLTAQLVRRFRKRISETTFAYSWGSPPACWNSRPWSQ
jgi:LysR family transcriptional regulator, nitrogen assimilation regulatory protein